MTIKKINGIFNNVVFLQRRVKESILAPIHVKKRVEKSNENEADDDDSRKIEAKKFRKKLKKLNNNY